MAPTSIAAKKGRAFLLQLGSGTSPESYTTITGMRTTDITINGSPVDITNKSSNGWQELLPGAGVRSADISAQGIYDGNVAVALSTLQQAALNGGDILNLRLLSEAGDYFVGWFSIATFKRNGPYNEAESFELTIRSHGVITHAGPNG